jgi:hypothetical protein
MTGFRERTWRVAWLCGEHCKCSAKLICVENTLYAGTKAFCTDGISQNATAKQMQTD